MKTLDKEGLQYTLQRMVTLLTAIQEKVNAPCPEYKEGTWEPVLFNTATNKVNVTATAGYYYKIGNLVFIDGFIHTDNACACEHIEGLPFEPYTARPTSAYPLCIMAQGTNENSPFNSIGGIKPYRVINALYSPDKTYNTWYVYGWYKITDTK